MGTPPEGAQHQMRRGTFTNLSTFMGARGEPLFDTFYWRLNMQDGATPGGFPHALALVQDIISSVGTIGNSVALARVWSTAAAATITLPSAAAYAPGQPLVIWDAAGASTVNNITVVTATSTDSVYTSTGGASTTAAVIATAGAGIKLTSNSSAHWMLSSI